MTESELDECAYARRDAIGTDRHMPMTDGERRYVRRAIEGMIIHAPAAAAIRAKVAEIEARKAATAPTNHTFDANDVRIIFNGKEITPMGEADEWSRMNLPTTFNPTAPFRWETADDARRRTASANGSEADKEARFVERALRYIAETRAKPTPAKPEPPALHTAADAYFRVMGGILSTTARHWSVADQREALRVHAQLGEALSVGKGRRQ